MKNFRFKMFKGRILVDNRDFQAADALDARFIAMSLYDACSYNCDAGELWEDGHYIDWKPLQRSAADISAATQDRLVDREVALSNSLWAMEHSRQLMERLEPNSKEIGL